MKKNETLGPAHDFSADRKALRKLLAPGRCAVAPETPDGLLAHMVALAGFQAAYVGMQGTALNRLASADAALLTASELIDNAARCLRASGLPTVVDAGSGFGNAMNVRRTVTELERAGAAAILLRDRQDEPAHRRPAASIAAADMAIKLRAARDASADPALVLVAGVDATLASGAGAAELASRAKQYLEAGADLIHLGLIDSHAQAAKLARALDGLPLACSLAATGDAGSGELANLGIQLAFIPHCGLMAAVPAIEHTFAELARTGSVGHLRAGIASFREFTDIAGLPQVQQLEDRYGVPEENRTAL